MAYWNHEESLKRLVRLVRVLRPDVIATMDPAPVGGQHGHHQAAGRLATEAFEAAADPKAFPELAEEEGLSPWRVQKLYWAGGGPNSHTQVQTDGVAKGELANSSPGMRYADIARLAESSHRSQGFDRYFGTAPAALSAPQPDRFILVKSRVPVDPGEESDLFANVGRAPATGGGAAVAPAAALAPGLQVRVWARPALHNYYRWLRSQSIERLMARLPAHVLVTLGARANLVAEISNNGRTVEHGSAELDLPAGWSVDARSKPFTASPGSTAYVTYVIVPSSTARVGSYDATVRVEGGQAETAKLDAMPMTVVHRLHAALPVDADVVKWQREGVAPVAIPPTSVAQGAAGGPNEISGQFYTAYSPEGLQVLVDVRDDTVVANIAPDDVKAHWRTTSTEICIDPSPRAENTFSTVKLGIVPADTSGHVRGARDADANPGPIERKDPAILLASRRTVTGYVVEARIPWTSLRKTPPYRPERGQWLGFNVILYHAGKKDARDGEDVNKSRLAWSPWRSVWGRPDAWGTAVLE
jgi:hypothetical protein